MDDLLGAMLSGADEESGEGQTGGDPLGGLLGSLLGGAGAQPEQGQAGGDALMDLLGDLSGGGGQQAGSPQGAGDMGGLLGALLDGGTGAGFGSLLDPVADALADKMGIPRERARAVVAFALSKLLPALLGGSEASASGGRGQDVDALVAQMNSEQGIDGDYLRSSGIAQELAEQTGLDPDTAEQSLEEVFSMLGQQMGEASASGPSQPQQSRPQLGGLDALLDNWDPQTD
jgi:hypothetical protein